MFNIIEINTDSIQSLNFDRAEFTPSHQRVLDELDPDLICDKWAPLWLGNPGDTGYVNKPVIGMLLRATETEFGRNLFWLCRDHRGNMQINVTNGRVDEDGFRTTNGRIVVITGDTSAYAPCVVSAFQHSWLRKAYNDLTKAVNRQS